MGGAFLNVSLEGPKIQTVFVTGATGLLGNNLVRLLVGRGIKVRALVRSVEKAQRQFHDLPVEIVQGDLDAASSFARAVEGTDAVFHTAAFFRDNYKGGTHREQLRQINVVGTANLLRVAYNAGVRRFVHTSSVAVLHGPKGATLNERMLRRLEDADEYYRSKILADREIEKFLKSHPDFWAAMVLPGWMHGPGDIGPTSAGQLVLDFAKGKLPGIVPGTFSLVDARDVAEAQWAVLNRGRRGERYLAAGRNMTMETLAPILEAATGVKAPTRRVPLCVLYLIAAANEAWARITARPILLSVSMVRLMSSEDGRTTFDHSKSERELGLQFRPIEDTLRDEVAWYRNQGWIR